jgi:hypothetical protein
VSPHWVCVPLLTVGRGQRLPDLQMSPRYSVAVASDLLGGALAVQHDVVKQPGWEDYLATFPNPA